MAIELAPYSTFTTQQSLPDLGQIGSLMQVLQTYPVAEPRLIRNRTLQRRWDRKYVLSEDQAANLLGHVIRDYAVVLADTAYAAQYHTQYFDTPERRFYHDHHRGRRKRAKLRIRHYPDRRLSYLELKLKQGWKQTTKHRWSKSFTDNALDGRDVERLDKRQIGSTDDLLPSIRVSYRRATLVGMKVEERVTLDAMLIFGHQREHRTFDGGLILETKNRRYAANTPVRHWLRESGIRPVSFSKYCYGTVALIPDVRSNRFRHFTRQHSSPNAG